MRPTVIPTRPDPGAFHPRTEALARNLERLAWLMDRALPIPGTKLRVGLDAILGLVPGVGDAVTGVVQIGLVLAAVHHYKVPKAVALRMATNVLIDTAFGSIPLVGDAFDVGFKANTRNVALLAQAREHQEQGKAMPSAPSVGYIVGIAAVLLLALGMVVAGLTAVVALVWKALAH